MTFYRKIAILLLVQAFTLSLSSQTLKGVVIDMEDSLPLRFATVALIDSSDRLFKIAMMDKNGGFNIQISNNASYLKISKQEEFVEINILNLKIKAGDTLDLGQIPLVEAPLFLQVQFKEISKRKERRWQRQLIKSYNKQVKSYDDMEITINHQKVTMRAKPTKQENTKRLKLKYILDLEDGLEKY